MNKQSSILEELLKKKGHRKPSDQLDKAHHFSLNSHSNLKNTQTPSTSSEIIVKVLNTGKHSGHGHTARSLNSCLHYIIKGTHDGKIYDMLGNEYVKEDIKTIVDMETTDFVESASEAKQKRRLFTHIAISLPNNVKKYSSFNQYNDEKLKDILLFTTINSVHEKYMYNNFYVAIQDNGNNLHAHVAIISKGANNRKLRINKSDIQELRVQVVKHLKEYDINLKATPFQRGSIKKPKIKRVHLECNFKVGEVYKTKAPLWFSQRQNISNDNLPNLKFNNKEEEENFNKLYKTFKKTYKHQHKKALTSFLLLYKENKSLAQWALHKQPKIFGTVNTKPDFKSLDTNKIYSNIILSNLHYSQDR